MLSFCKDCGVCFLRGDERTAMLDVEGCGVEVPLCALKKGDEFRIIEPDGHFAFDGELFTADEDATFVGEFRVYSVVAS